MKKYCQATLSNNKNMLNQPAPPCNTLISSGPQQCEKTFSASFVPQPAENNTCFISCKVKTIKAITLEYILLYSVKANLDFDIKPFNIT